MKKMNLQMFAETLPENTITPELNYETEAFINTTPGEETATDDRMAPERDRQRNGDDDRIERRVQSF